MSLFAELQAWVPLNGTPPPHTHIHLFAIFNAGFFHWLKNREGVGGNAPDKPSHP